MDYTHQPPQSHFTWQQVYRLRNLDRIEQLVGCVAPCIRKWVEHDAYDEYWRAIDQDLMLPRVRVPALHTGGWYDHISRNQLHCYRTLKREAATQVARENQQLLMVPGGHMSIMAPPDTQRRYGDWDFGPEAGFDTFAYNAQFIDRFLQDRDDGFKGRPAVKVFLMRTAGGRWLDLHDWPVPDATTRELHLGSNGSANMLTGNGRLADTPGAPSEDAFRYDPADPVPTLGGPIYWGMEDMGPVGPVDQARILHRPDVLVYRAEPCEKPMAVVGEIELDLHVASDAEDTDVIAKLCVQRTDGRIYPLTVGSLRLRYRESWSDPKPLDGEPVRVTVRLGQTAYEYAAGERVVLLVTSSDFPRILPNDNTMAPTWTEKHPRVARNRVLHGQRQPSVLRLPVAEV